MTTKTQLTIATRESALALWQANWVKAQLEKIHPQLTVNLLGLTTQADKMLATPLFKIGGKGLFVKELEEALLDGRADIAVHSMKDVPMVFPAGLCLPVVCEREEPRDAFVSNQFNSVAALPTGAVVGTSSLRRQSQLLAMRPDLQIVPLRGNVNTRLAKLDQGDFTAIILAAAGLKRLNLADRIRAYFDFDVMLPAAGQGILGIECRAGDTETERLIQPLNDRIASHAATAERAMCRFLGGGCHVPIAAFAEVGAAEMTLRGLVATPDGKIILQVEQTDVHQHAEQLGINVAKALIAKGAKDVLTLCESP